MTAMAFLQFARSRCDLSVIEAGMGGRLDATNIVTPEVSVITSISLDHCEFLGDTVEKIAAATPAGRQTLLFSATLDGGIAQLGRVPAALFIVDIGHEHIALAEARKLGISTFGVVDTNCDPNKVDYPVPANDDATKSIAIITNYITAAIAEGLAERQAEKADEGEEGDEGADKNLRFSVEEEDKDRGDRRGKPQPKRRVAGPGGGGRRPATKR